jgi:hypothetical protein
MTAENRGGDIEHESPQPKFELGQLVGTPGALEAVQRNGPEPFDFLLRHVTADWGDLEDEDKEENDFSVEKELRILSAYNLNDGTRVWIITEADRSTTTVLLPEEY